MLLSIIIPTKNRYQCLKETVSALACLALSDSEIVIQDNTEDNQEFLDFLRSRSFSQVKYFHHKEPVSVSRNTDMAIQHSCGDYVCFIGDDDAVAPQIVELVRYMNCKGIDACAVPYARFNWPELLALTGNDRAVELFRGMDGTIENINGMTELHTIMRTAIFSLIRLPKLYQGIVSRKVLDRIKEISGSYCPGPSPDMANAVGVCCESGKCIYVHSPVIIAGFSKQSASGLGSLGKHVNAIDKVPWLDKTVVREWDARIPRIWTGQTIWAESILKALKKMNRQDEIAKFNFIRLYSSFIVSHPDLLSYVLKTENKLKIMFLFDFPIYVAKKIVEKAISRYKNNKGLVLSRNPVNLSDGIELISKYIAENPILYP